MECINAGQLNQDGACTLFTKVNDHGLVLFECNDVTYTPATCPDDPAEGVFAVGPAAVKIASVDGTVVDTLVQRANDGSAWAVEVGIDAQPCDHFGTLIQERAVSIGNGDINNDVGINQVASALRLRGNGDLAIPYRGSYTAPSNLSGFAEIRRKGGSEGIVEYSNFSGPDYNQSLGHLFMTEQSDPSSQLNLMRLTPTGGTLYFPAWTYVSDERLKDNITPLDGQAALGVVLGISPIAYAMNGRRYHGFSAQNVQAVLPDAVNAPATKDAPMTMRDSDIVANLVAAVKYLAARVEALEKAGA